MKTTLKLFLILVTGATLAQSIFAEELELDKPESTLINHELGVLKIWINNEFQTANDEHVKSALALVLEQLKQFQGSISANILRGARELSHNELDKLISRLLGFVGGFVTDEAFLARVYQGASGENARVYAKAALFMKLISQLHLKLQAKLQALKKSTISCQEENIEGQGVLAENTLRQANDYIQLAARQLAQIVIDENQLQSLIEVTMNEERMEERTNGIDLNVLCNCVLQGNQTMQVVDQ